MQAVAAPTPDLVKELATHAPGSGVLSAHLRTDPRDPANTNHQPAWHISLRNGLRAIEADLEAGEDRDARLAFRELSERVDLALPDLQAAERGRSLSVFTTADGSLDVRITLQLPLLTDTVRWDARPFISPLVDVVDHGRSTGLVLVDSDDVVLLHWEGGRITEPEQSRYALELGDWTGRESGPHDRMSGAQRASHGEHHESRIDDHKRRFLTDAAGSIAARLDELGWRRLLVAAAPGTADVFTGALPDQTRERIAVTLDAHLTGEDVGSIAEHVDAPLEEAWRREVSVTVDEARSHSAAGGAGATGAAEVLDALAQGRVAHLVYDPQLTIPGSSVGPQVAAVFGEVPEALIIERTVEHAVETDAGVSAIGDHAGLQEAGGIVATLRY
ncbi:MAG: VLRF1 family aeRF1-type release factor [Solirubrobacteraceae bacterium]